MQLGLLLQIGQAVQHQDVSIISDAPISTIIILLLPRTHAQGVKRSVCLSVVVVNTKMASSGHVGV